MSDEEKILDQKVEEMTVGLNLNRLNWAVPYFSCVLLILLDAALIHNMRHQLKLLNFFVVNLISLIN